MLRFFSRKTGPVVAACLLVLPTLSACSLSVGPGNPRPNLALVEQPHSMALVIGGAVENNFEVPGRSQIRDGRVEGWHATLTAGFQNGFARAFHLIHGAEGSDFTLVLDEVGLEFVPAAVSVQGVTAVKAQIRWRATLVRENGEQRAAAGTAESKRATTVASEVTDVAVSAVETMYEDIARQLFAPAAAARADSSPSSAPPSQSL